MTSTELSVEQLETAANKLKAIAHPIRIAIIAHLEKEIELTVTKIHELLGIEQSTASHHLGILKDKGVLKSKREGKNIFYSLKHEEVGKIIECMKNCAEKT